MIALILNNAQSWEALAQLWEGGGGFQPPPPDHVSLTNWELTSAMHHPLAGWYRSEPTKITLFRLLTKRIQSRQLVGDQR